MTCIIKLYKLYYLVGFNLLIAGSVSSQGLTHVADIFRILNHVEIPPTDSFIPIVPPQLPSFLGKDHLPGIIPEVEDIKLYVIDEDNPTIKQEVSRVNYRSRMTGGFKNGVIQTLKDGLHQGHQIHRDDENIKVEQQFRDGAERIQVAVTGETDTDNEVELIEENTNKMRNKLKIIVHGWGESANRSWFAQMTAAYMLKETERKLSMPKSEYAEDLKVLQVDWSVQAAAPYFVAARNTKRVGAYVGQFIVDLHKNLGYALDDIHVIGHSLGAHVAGFIGKEILRLTGQPVARITALDPAGPLFEGSLIAREDGLSDSDAKLVDVVHTDGGFFGCKVPLGTVDFYPNGGERVQPGCNSIGSTRLTMDDILDFAFCSHTRSYKYFIESIESRSVMEATKCDSWANFEAGLCSDEVKITFGEDITVDAPKGAYFFHTNSEPPFAKAE